MKKILYTAVATAACSLVSVGAYAAGGVGGIIGGVGNVNGGYFDGTGVIIGGGVSWEYSGGTFSGMTGQSGVMTSLEAVNGGVSSQALVIGGSLVGSMSSADFSNPTNPMHQSASYQLGANFQQSSAYADGGTVLGLPVSHGNEATVNAVSFQDFETGASTTLDTEMALGGVYADIDANWGSFETDWIAGIGGFVTW